MGNKDNKIYVQKRKKNERLKILARNMREAKQKKKEYKFIKLECHPEQGKLLESPSQLHNLVSVPANYEDKSDRSNNNESLNNENRHGNSSTSSSLVQGLDHDDANSDAEDKPGTSSQNMKQDSPSSANEIKVFCPNCNTEVPLTAEGIQEDQTKILVAKVYHYFEHEYEELKKMYGDLDLTPLSKFRQRTALATGVSETTVLEILKEEEGRKADKRQEPTEKRRSARKRARQTESSSEEDSSDSSDDNVDHGGPSSFVQVALNQSEIETLVVKIEPPEYYKEQAQTIPISAEVKAEPADDDVNNTNETLAVNEPAGTKRKAIKIPRSDVTSTRQHTQGESSTTAAGSNVRLTKELVESGLLGEAEVKVEKIEIGEEGFS